MKLQIPQKAGHIFDQLHDCQLLEEEDVLHVCSCVVFLYLINIAVFSFVSTGTGVLRKFK
jgi:hypothetical protein